MNLPTLRNRTIVPFLLAALLGAPAIARADAPAPPSWKQVKVVDGIVVRTAPSGVKPPWGSAMGTIDAPPARVLAHLLDFADAPKHVPRLAEARVLRRGDDEAVVYFFLDLPWPISNRDYTARFRWQTRPDGDVVLLVEDDNREGPPERGAIRVTLLRGLWRLHPVDGGRRTEARYDFLGDFGGMMTRSMIEQTDWKNPLETIQGVRKALAPQRR